MSYVNDYNLLLLNRRLNEYRRFLYAHSVPPITLQLLTHSEIDGCREYMMVLYII